MIIGAFLALSVAGSYAEAPILTYKVGETYPHDPESFTQGLFFHDGFLYESTGLKGHSKLKRVDLKTGKFRQIKALPSKRFGEGITLYSNVIVQLTWKSNIGYVYDLGTFKRLKMFNYDTEGWGITCDGTSLIMSDGSSTLRWWNPETYQVEKELIITDEGKPVAKLNELECIKGRIWANIWQTDRIAMIDPETGHVDSWLDLGGLLSEKDKTVITSFGTHSVDVLNGIAYDVDADRIFVTGKFWPKLFEIKVPEIE